MVWVKISCQDVVFNYESLLPILKDLEGLEQSLW